MAWVSWRGDESNLRSTVAAKCGGTDFLIAMRRMAICFLYAECSEFC